MSKLNLEFDNYVHPGKRVGRQGVQLGHGQGMSLRDYFAGQAMTQWNPADIDDPALFARGCYELADAMLETRLRDC